MMKNTLTVAALIVATMLTGTAQAVAGDWLVRGRVISVRPSASSSPLAGVGASNKATVEADFTRFMTDNVALELILATTKHNINLTGTPLGSVGVLPPTLTVQYHFSPDAQVSPYLGAGLNYTRFYSVNLPGFNVSRNSTGGALQAGVDFKINKDMFINVDVKKIYIKTDVSTAAGAYVTTLKINPVVLGVGVGWKF
jgi:outer membrane protein